MTDQRDWAIGHGRCDIDVDLMLAAAVALGRRGDDRAAERAVEAAGRLWRIRTEERGPPGASAGAGG